MAEHTQYVVAQILEAMQRRPGDVGTAVIWGIVRRGGGSGDQRAESNSKEHPRGPQAGTLRARARELAAHGGRLGGGVRVQNALRHVREPRGNV